MELKYIVNMDDEFISINELLAVKFSFSTRLLNKLIKNKKIFRNNISVDTREKPKTNDVITIDLSYEEDNENIVPTIIPLDIVYEDDWILVINKPSGIAVHPSILHFDDSLSNGVRYYFDKIGLKKKIRPVNRLDLNTSGIVIFAKCEYIQECLIRQMNTNNFKKEYWCIVNGFFDDNIKGGTINKPIARKPGSIIERCVDYSKGQTSITHYEILKKLEKINCTYIRCNLETGRTHQIRVHFSSMGHSLLGDSLYGNSSNLIDRQALHCFKISFIHPITKKEITFTANLPKDMEALI